jgi:hypothetical protein
MVTEYNHSAITGVQYEGRMKKVRRPAQLLRPTQVHMTNW